MRTLRLTLSYDGTDYVGWQRQAGGRSIQGELERALAEIEGQSVAVYGAGRTDAGVHALGQVVSVRLAHRIEAATLTRALNAKLPLDIRVAHAAEATDQFHARFGAKQKTYRYQIETGEVADPFLRRYAWRVTDPLDIAAMRDGAAPLAGEHDFAAFQAAGAGAGSTVRTIHTLTVEPLGPRSFLDTPGLTITVTGDGFLRHMVRIIAGTLIDIGSGRRAAADAADVLASRDRTRAGPTAPPHGLFLVSVDYAGGSPAETGGMPI